MKLSQLRILHDFAVTSSSDETARRFGIQDIDVIHALRELSDELGCELYIWPGTDAVLTREGWRTAARYDKILRVLDSMKTGGEKSGDAEDPAADPGPALTGPLTVAATPYMAERFLQDALRRLVCEHPGITIRLRETDARTVAELVRDGHADLGLAPAVDGFSELFFTLILTERCFLAAGSANFSLYRQRLEDGQCEDSDFVFGAEDSELHELSMHWLEERAFHDPAKTPHLVSGFEALCALVSRGAGITILPESCLPRDRDAAIASGLLRIGPDLAAGSFTCCLVERQGAARSVQADVFRALVLSLDDDHAGKAADKTGSSARKAAPVSLRTRTADREIRVAGAKETIALAGGKTAGRTVVWADSAADRNAPTGEDPIIFNALPPGIPARSKRTTLRVRWKEAEHITAKERKLIYDEPEYAPAVARVLIAHPDPASLTRSGRWTAKVQVRHPVTGKSFSGHAGPSPEELEAARKPPAMGTLANNIWDALPVPGTDRYWAEHQRFEMIMRDDGFRDTTGTVPMLHVTDITGFVWVREGNEVYSGYLQDWAMDFQRLYREWLAAAGSSSKLSSIRREFRRLWYVPPTKAHPEGDDKNGFLNWLNAALLVSAWLRLGWMYPNGLDAEGKPAFPRDLPALQEITDRYGCKVQVRPSIFHTEDGLADTEQWLDFLRHPETYLVDFKLMPKRDKEQFRDVCLTIADAHDAIMLDHTEGADKNPYLSAFHTWVIDQGPAPDKGKSRRGRGRRQR